MHWVQRLSACSRVGWQPSVCFRPVCRSGASADEFRTPSISAVRVEWRAVLDQLRSEINTQPAIASAFTFASQRRVPALGSALDAGAGATERDHLAGLRRDRTQPGAGAVAVRHRELSRSARRAARPTACRCRAIRPTSAPPICFTPAPPATTRCFRSSRAPATACRSGPSPSRSRCRSPARS